MGKINLCIDIGNTSTKAALYKNGKEIEYMKPFTASLLEKYINNSEVQILVSKTGSNEEIESLLQPSQFLTYKNKLPIELDYNTPETLGPDRISTAVAAYNIDPLSSWLIIDLGTCLTIDYLSHGVFRGGMISPGVDMRFKAMDVFTASLPLAYTDYDIYFPGKNTLESMQVGVCQSIMYEINGYVALLNSKVHRPKLLDCSSRNLHFAKDLKNEIFARPKSVLQGLNYIIENNAQK